MKKEEFKKKPYLRPTLEVVKLDVEVQILAGSPPVQPGGGGGGSITIEDPVEDDDDNQLSGAKEFNMWSDWED